MARIIIASLSCLVLCSLVSGGTAAKAVQTPRRLLADHPGSVDQSAIASAIQQKVVTAIRAAASGEIKTEVATRAGATLAKDATSRNQAFLFSTEAQDGDRRRLAGQGNRGSRTGNAAVATLLAQAATSNAINRAANGDLSASRAAQTGVVTARLATLAAQGNDFAEDLLFGIGGKR